MTHQAMGPRSTTRATEGVLAALITSVLLASGPWVITDVSAAEDDESLVSSVSGSMMMETVQALEAFGSREFHLDSSREAAEFLYDRFDSLGMSVELQHFVVGDAQVSNVVATIEGHHDEAGAYLFGAHYDSENSAVYNLLSAEQLSAPGADDDASGVAAVLEMARVLSGSHFPATVKFVMFGAEEYGYDNSGGTNGSEYFVAQEVEAGQTYVGTAVLDMIGYRTGPQNRASLILNQDGCVLEQSTVDAVDTFGIDLDLDVYRLAGITYSDHASFWSAGIPSMLVIQELDFQYYPVNPYYHTSDDTSSTLSTEQLEAVTKALLGGLLLSNDDDGDTTVLVFGTVIMSAAIVSIALFMYFRRKRGRV